MWKNIIKNWSNRLNDVQEIKVNFCKSMFKLKKNVKFYAVSMISIFRKKNSVYETIFKIIWQRKRKN